eukprot:1158815-Pelagomonas_calceolata.AAC.15
MVEKAHSYDEKQHQIDKRGSNKQHGVQSMVEKAHHTNQHHTKNIISMATEHIRHVPKPCHALVLLRFEHKRHVPQPCHALVFLKLSTRNMCHNHAMLMSS